MVGKARTFAQTPAEIMEKSAPSIILGIDPGSNLLGYAFLQVPVGGKPNLVMMDVLDMRKEDDHFAKLQRIFVELTRLIGLYAPTEVAIEAPFYGKDVQAMLKLGRAQGVAITAAINQGLSVEEYSPRSIKKAVTGNGNASKEQVAKMLPHLINGEIAYKFLDASDALGVAYCHYIERSSVLGGGKKHKGWGDFLKNNNDRIEKL